MRAAWRALVAADTLHRALLKTRPYETAPGAADGAFQESMTDLCKTIESELRRRRVPACRDGGIDDARARTVPPRADAL